MGRGLEPSLVNLETFLSNVSPTLCRQTENSMKRNLIGALGMVLAFAASCTKKEKPPIYGSAGVAGRAGAPGVVAAGGVAGSSGAAGAGGAGGPGIACREGTAPSVSPPPEFDPNCPPLEPATEALCVQHELLFNESLRMCMKREDCAEGLHPEGNLCVGSGAASNPGCNPPTGVRRCWGSVCVCSAT